MDHVHDIREELRGPATDLRSEIPGVLRAFGELSSAAMADGEVPALYKELVATAIAVTRECDGCIASHVRGVVRHGGTRRQLAEVLGVAILMNGGPGTVWGPRALAAFDQVVDEHARREAGQSKL